MFVTQLSIFIENRFGRIAELTRLLADNGIDMRTISIADSMSKLNSVTDEIRDEMYSLCGNVSPDYDLSNVSRSTLEKLKDLSVENLMKMMGKTQPQEG